MQSAWTGGLKATAAIVPESFLDREASHWSRILDERDVSLHRMETRRRTQWNYAELDREATTDPSSVQGSRR